MTRKPYSETYRAAPLSRVAFTMDTTLWATCKGSDVIDVYDNREMAEAWVEYMNRRAAL